MRPVSIIEGRAYPFGAANVDTDVIIPARYMKAVDRAGLGVGAFESLRANGDSIFDEAPFQGAPILIAGENFGCGSSREHAVWALMEMGVQAIIAESFSDIFAGNAATNGLLLISLGRETVATLLRVAWDGALHIDLEACQIRTSTAEQIEFALENTLRRNLLEGRDPIAVTLAEADRITAHERNRGAFAQWLS